MTPTLVAEAVTAGYGSRMVVSGVSLASPAGSVLAIVGLNGAGKTTLLRTMAGLKRPVAGRVLIDGTDVHQRNTQVNVALVLQSVTIDRQITGREYLEFAGRARGFAKRAARATAAAVVDGFDLGDFVDRRGGQMSGGQARRLQLAGSLVRQPRVLLLDEPTTGLDPAARRRYWTVLRKLANQGLTLVMVTHHIDEANLADQVLILADGRVVSSGRPRDLVGQASLSILEVDCARPDDALAVHQHIGAGAAELSGTLVTVTTADSVGVLAKIGILLSNQDYEVRMRPATLDDLLVHLARQRADATDE
jgi:ABC-type multidrug transport system ATPase subunit